MKLLKVPENGIVRCERHRHIFAKKNAKTNTRHDPADPDLLSHFTCWLKAYRLHKYLDMLKHLEYKQMKKLDNKRLEQLGITAQGARDLLIELLGRIPEEEELEVTSDNVTGNSPPTMPVRQSNSANSFAPQHFVLIPHNVINYYPPNTADPGMESRFADFFAIQPYLQLPSWNLDVVKAMFLADVNVAPLV
ncbi:Flap-structured DNA-binding and RNA-binding protein [Gnomoniopsis sp. IMI 355080]|nr:Flap-structured DNA-binding and RNA-binding protein [Gnomoniopsis sp. IMI 355080]